MIWIVGANGEPIQARPVNWAEKLARWRRRKPALAASLALVGVLLMFVVIGSPIAIYQINRARLQAEQARRDEAAQRRRAETREQLVNAQLLCDEHFEDAAKLVYGIPFKALQAERENAAVTFSRLADSYACHGRWSEALQHAVQALEYKPQDHMNYVSLLALLAPRGTCLTTIAIATSSSNGSAISRIHFLGNELLRRA